MSVSAPAPTTNLYAKMRLYVAAAILICPPLSAATPNATEQDAGAPADNAKTTEITLWAGSVSEARKAHETEVVKLALEKSRDRYGPYHLKVISTLLSRPRTIRNLSEGSIAQVVTAPALAYRVASKEQPLITIPIPLLQGLLGNRKAIVRRDRAADFANIKTLAQLRQFNAGIGVDWLDQDYFRDAGLAFTIGTDISQLLNMLTHDRFDYLPLGILEASSALAASEHANELVIVDNFTLHYPMPVYAQVSHNYPDIAERLTLGLERARDDGSLTALFNRHYGQLTNANLEAVTIELTGQQPAPPNERQTSP